MASPPRPASSQLRCNPGDWIYSRRFEGASSIRGLAATAAARKGNCNFSIPTSNLNFANPPNYLGEQALGWGESDGRLGRRRMIGARKHVLQRLQLPDAI